MRTIQDIQEKMFLVQDKIKMMEMILGHAKSDAHKLQEMIFDMEENLWLEKIANQNKGVL